MKVDRDKGEFANGDYCSACNKATIVTRWHAGGPGGPPRWQCECGQFNVKDHSGGGGFAREKPDQEIP